LRVFKIACCKYKNERACFGIFLFFEISCDEQTISEAANASAGQIQTGDENLDNLIQILLSTGMFVAGAIAFFLDNTIPGTDEERGLARREAVKKAAALAGDSTYDFPQAIDVFQKSVFSSFPINSQYHAYLVAKKMGNCKS
jgi:hypothetical protein